MVNHPRRHPILGGSEIVTGNPILEGLGVDPAEIQAHDPAEVDVSIYVNGVRVRCAAGFRRGPEGPRRPDF